MLTLAFDDAAAAIIHSALGGILLNPEARIALQKRFTGPKHQAGILMLDLSTGHLSESTCNQHLPTRSAVWRKGEYGFFVYVPDNDADTEDVDEAPTPPDLARVFAFARAQGAAYIMFDCDAPQTDGLPVFDW